MRHILTIDASPGQLRKLRTGRPVRIKQGTGFNLIVHPSTYHLASRAFSRKSGLQVSLSPEEIEMNRSVSPEEHMALRESGDTQAIAGRGIFGPKFDRMLKKAGIKKAAYAIGEHFKTPLKGAVTAGIASGAAALGAAQPELIPLIAPGAIGLTSFANDYIDNPNKYHGKTGLTAPRVSSLAQQAAKAKAAEVVNRELGTNYDYMSRAGMDKAISDALTAQHTAQSIDSRFAMAPAPYDGFRGRGICHERRASGGSVGLHGSMLIHKAPALKSQPMSANFQFQHFLPPAYQAYNSGSGLYAGKGLYS